MSIELDKIYQMDAIELMKQLPDNSVDLILTDPPYNMTALEWDKKINLDKLWSEFKRIGKENCVFIFTASQPFTSILVMSNLKMFKHEWIWEKQKASNFMSMKYQPAKYHENIIVFSKGKIKYNPIKWFVDESKRDKRKIINNPKTNKSCHLGSIKRIRKKDDGSRYPKSIIKINKSINKNQHPTQKPLELFEYLIKTYSDRGDVVLDPYMGSGTTAVACKQLGRRFIGSEINQKYVEIAKKRLAQETLI